MAKHWIEEEGRLEGEKRYMCVVARTVGEVTYLRTCFRAPEKEKKDAGGKKPKKKKPLRS